MAIIFTWLWLAIVGFKALSRHVLKQDVKGLPTCEWLQSVHVSPEQLLPHPEAPTSAPETKSKTKTPFYSAILSGLYPGLGQFYNGSLWRGVLFLIFFTTALTVTFRIFMIWYWQHMEVPAALIVLFITGLVSIWALAIVDAYADVTPKPTP